MFSQLFNFPKANQYSLAAKLRGHTRPINCLAFNANAEILASGGDDEEVRLWDVATSSQLQVLSDQTGNWGQITCLMFLDTGSSADWLCIGTGRGRIVVYKRQKRNANFVEVACTRVFAYGDSVESIAFDGKHLKLAATSHYGKTKMFTYSLGTLTELWQVDHMDAIPRAIRFSDNGNNVVVYGLEGGTIVCRDAQTSTERYKKALKTSIGNLTECRTSHCLIIDNLDDGFNLYPPTQTSPTVQFKVPTTRRFVKKAVFGEKGRIVACGSDHGLAYLFALESTNPIQTLRHGEDLDLIQAVEAATSDESYIIATASSSPNYLVCLWKQPKPQPVTTRRRKKAVDSSSALLHVMITINLVIFIGFICYISSEMWLPVAKDTVGLAASTFSRMQRSVEDAWITGASESESNVQVRTIKRPDITELVRNLDDKTLKKLLLQRLGEEEEAPESDETDDAGNEIDGGGEFDEGDEMDDAGDEIEEDDSIKGGDSIKGDDSIKEDD